MTIDNLMSEIKQKYGEHIEMAGPNAPRLMNTILTNLLLKERGRVEYLKKRLAEYENKGGKQ
jgi:hypothetical protein